jgi:integrase
MDSFFLSVFYWFYLRFQLASSSPRYSLNKNKYLLPPEVDRLKKIISDFEVSDTRNCLLIGLALRTGARAQELLNLNLGDINAYDETVFIRGIKNSNDREIPLHADFFKRLHRFASEQDGRRLFPITYDRLYQIWLHYRPIPKKFHSLRHTFAIELYQKTKDLRLVQVALGHRNITNTMIYADYVYSQQELRKLIL